MPKKGKEAHPKSWKSNLKPSAAHTLMCIFRRSDPEAMVVSERVIRASLDINKIFGGAEIKAFAKFPTCTLTYTRNKHNPEMNGSMSFNCSETIEAEFKEKFKKLDMQWSQVLDEEHIMNHSRLDIRYLLKQLPLQYGMLYSIKHTARKGDTKDRVVASGKDTVVVGGPEGLLFHESPVKPMKPPGKPPLSTFSAEALSAIDFREMSETDVKNAFLRGEVPKRSLEEENVMVVEPKARSPIPVGADMGARDKHLEDLRKWKPPSTPNHHYRIQSLYLSGGKALMKTMKTYGYVSSGY